VSGHEAPFSVAFVKAVKRVQGPPNCKVARNDAESYRFGVSHKQSPGVRARGGTLKV
jgi:hypothetical protein